MCKQKPHAKGSRLWNEGYVLSRFYDIELCARAQIRGLVWAQRLEGVRASWAYRRADEPKLDCIVRAMESSSADYFPYTLEML